MLLILQSICLQNLFRIHCRMALLSLQDGESVITVLVEDLEKDVIVCFIPSPVIGYE
jgi:hypothetical protein